jgi:uridylate kinase
MVKVISLGGSIVAPEFVDTAYLRDFSALVREYLSEDEKRRLIIVVGGGGLARLYQKACKEIAPGTEPDSLDWIGIMATRLNAQLLKGIFAELCPQDVVTDPTKAELFAGRILVAAGWKPGFSTDYDAVLLAERFGAELIVNLTNIAKVYTADPKLDHRAKPIDSISWADFKKIVGKEWTPGKNVPFDPVATRHAAKLKLKVASAAGKNLPNLKKILLGEAFEGTLIGA